MTRPMKKQPKHKTPAKGRPRASALNDSDLFFDPVYGNDTFLYSAVIRRRKDPDVYDTSNSYCRCKKRVRKVFFRALYGCGGRPVFNSSGVFICRSLHWLT